MLPSLSHESGCTGCLTECSSWTWKPTRPPRRTQKKAPKKSAKKCATMRATQQKQGVVEVPQMGSASLFSRLWALHGAHNWRETRVSTARRTFCEHFWRHFAGAFSSTLFGALVGASVVKINQEATSHTPLNRTSTQ